MLTPGRRSCPPARNGQDVPTARSEREPRRGRESPAVRGIATAVDGSAPAIVSFDTSQWPGQSVAYTRMQTVNDSTSASTRVSRIGGDTLDVAIREEANMSGDATSDHATESVGYVVTNVEFGTSSSESTATALVTNAWVTHGFTGNYDAEPVPIHAMQSRYGYNATDLRYRNQTSDQFELKTQEEQPADAETNHIGELVATLAFGGSGPIYEG